MIDRRPPTLLTARLLAHGCVAFLLALALGASCAGGGGGAGSDDGAAPSDVPAAPEDGGVAPDSGPDSALDAAPDTPEPLDPGVIDGGERVVWTPEGVAEDGAAFPIGVQAGVMADDRVLFWTRTGPDAAVALRVFRESEVAGEVVLVKDETHPADHHGFVHAMVSGLAPGTWYRYVFLVPGAAAGEFEGRSAVGRVRTAFAPGTLERLTISATHGTHWRERPYETLIRASERNPDFFLHLGDIGYYDQRYDGEPDIAGTYRALWAENLSDPGFRAILSRTGFLPVWDDHEVWNNYDPETIDPAHFDAARDVFFDFVPLPRLDGAPRQLWRSFRWGDTAEIFVLDCRSERKPSTRDTPDARYVSPEQMTWLKAGLQASTATFKVIANSVPITRLTSPWWDSMREDSWGGYGAQRDEILGFVDEQEIPNVYWLTGDIHLGGVMRIEPTGPRSEMYEVVCGPGGNRSNPLPELVEQGYFPREEIFPDESFLFWSGRLAVTEVTFDPTTDPPSVEVVFIDGETGAVNGQVTLPEQ